MGEFQKVTRSDGEGGTVTKKMYVPNKKGLEGTISANDLTSPVEAPPITPVEQPEMPVNADSKIENVLGSIRSTSENAQKLAEEQAAMSQFVGAQDGFAMQQDMLNQYGVTPEKLSRLEDIELQLAGRKTASELTQSRIAGAAGQTLAQGQREITQEQREEAIRSTGLAAEAAVLQGNIETGRSLAMDAMNIALQDRTFKYNAKRQDIEDLKDVVDEETRQLLLAEDRENEEEKAAIEEVKNWAADAMVNGATQAEVNQLTDPDVDDETKLALSKSIVARNAREEIAIDRAPKGGGGSTPSEEEPMTINQIEQFRRSYGWTPPFGFTESQLLQFMKDNPNATPEELEAGAKTVLAEGGGEEAPTEEAQMTADDFIGEVMGQINTGDLKQLKAKSDEEGTSKWYTHKKVDVERYLNSIKDKIQTALDAGHKYEDIVAFLIE